MAMVVVVAIVVVVVAVVEVARRGLGNGGCSGVDIGNDIDRGSGITITT